MTVAEVQQRVWLRRAAVLGAGVMGRTIAAHLANTGIPTVMLDLGDLAHKAHQSLRRIDPAALFLPDLDRLIEPGSLENDLARAAEADWIIEAIIEDLPTKQALLARLLPFWRPGTVVTTNTSGLPVGRIAEETPAEFRRFFLGAHFFNPPRYMKLLEIIPTPDPAAGEAARALPPAGAAARDGAPRLDRGEEGRRFLPPRRRRDSGAGSVHDGLPATAEGVLPLGRNDDDAGGPGGPAARGPLRR